MHTANFVTSARCETQFTLLTITVNNLGPEINALVTHVLAVNSSLSKS
jgi:hypothetical protein